MATVILTMTLLLVMITYKNWKSKILVCCWSWERLKDEVGNVGVMNL